MTQWRDAEVRAALGLDGRETDRVYEAVSTDTRTLPEGALFVALHGENHDAHDHLREAAEKGAPGAVVERIPSDAPESLVYYVVDDTLAALGRLARAYRRRLDARVCAITGTSGKTTTKEMARAVLSARYRVHATSGNLNNLIGTPLTILSAPPETEVLVVEVGTNAPGEIARLAEISEPDVAIITTVGAGHLEGLGTVEGVLDEKTSLLAGLPEDGLALVAEEPKALVDRARGMAKRVRVAGWTDRADEGLRATDVRLDDEGHPLFRWGGKEIRLAFRGRPHVRNALLALGLGQEWGVDPADAARTIEGAEPVGMRGEIVRYGDLRVIADCYNSNPSSLDAAVDLLASIPRGGGRVAVVGTMRELGEQSARLHRESAERLAEAEPDLIVATGAFVEAFEPLAERLGDALIRADDPLDAYDAFAPRLRGDEVILLKASRGEALERLLPRFERAWSTAGAGAGDDVSRKGG